MAFSRRLEGHPYLSVNPFVCQPLCLSTPLSVNPFVCQPLCQSTPLSVNPFVSQPLWLALPTVRIPRNRLTPDPSSQANATSSPRLPFPFPFLSPFSFLLSSLSYILLLLLFPFPFSSRLPWNSRPSCPCPCPCPCPPSALSFYFLGSETSFSLPFTSFSTLLAQNRPFHSRLPPSRHFWLRNVHFTPVCLLPVTSGSESSFSGCLFCSRGVLFRPSGNRERDGGPEKGWNGPGVRSGNEVRQKKV